MQEHSLDQLAKELAEGTITRGRALKLVGVALLEVFGLAGLPTLAQAKKKKKKKRKKKHHLALPSPPPPCDSATCSKGCCVNNTCHTNDPQFCGTGGGACVTCPTGQACCSGICTPLNTQQNCGACGLACSAGCLCHPTSEGNVFCVKGGIPCFTNCTTNADCPGSTTCEGVPNKVCSCTSSSQCPSGTFCDAVSTVGGVHTCQPPCGQMCP